VPIPSSRDSRQRGWGGMFSSMFDSTTKVVDDPSTSATTSEKYDLSPLPPEKMNISAPHPFARSEKISARRSGTWTPSTVMKGVVAVGPWPLHILSGYVKSSMSEKFELAVCSVQDLLFSHCLHFELLQETHGFNIIEHREEHRDEHLGYL
ncbi:hypothetical protein H0H93_007962, partial [Arthromyces matolae]